MFRGSASSLLGIRGSRMPVIPTHADIRSVYSDTTLGIYHFKNGEICLEKRQPPELREDEDPLHETIVALMEPHSPRLDVALAFNFPEPLKSLFIRLAHTCTDGTVEQVESVDAEIQSDVGFSILSNRLVLESLVCLAIATKNYPLVKAFVARGSPPPEVETKFLWNWREHGARGDVITDPSTTTALLRHRWLKIEDNYADQVARISDETMAIERIDVLVEIGYKFIPTTTDHLRAKYTLLLTQVVIAKGPISILRHLVSRVPIPSNDPLYKCLIPIAAVYVEDATEVIKVLLGQGLDVNAKEKSWNGIPRTALHAAIRRNLVDNVNCLLRHGAKMLRDGDGRTPLGLAEHLKRPTITYLIRNYLEEKSLAFDYAEEDPVVS